MVLAVKLALAPLLLAQGVLTRARLPRLPEAEGPRQGRVGRGRALRLLVAGDSSAAGVGVAHQRDALAAPLAARLAERLGVAVHWRLLAHSGLDTAQTLALLQSQAGLRADLAVVVTGVNDVTGLVPVRRALAARQALADWLQGTAGARHVAFTPLPPVHAFPGLPQPLRWVAGVDARRHNAALRGWAAGRRDRSCVDMTLPLDPSAMAVDGFHPGARAYAWCAEAIARHLAAQALHFHPDDEETLP
jgi:lysophospholipase L1-like esterase